MRFVIVNTMDSPSRRNVAEKRRDGSYAYMARGEDKYLRRFDGMTPRRPTPVEDFGFDVEIVGSSAHFTKVRESVATYEDGKLRHWQDYRWVDSFTLPLLKSTRVNTKEGR